jgi:hypothetical protein
MQQQQQREPAAGEPPPSCLSLLACLSLTGMPLSEVQPRSCEKAWLLHPQQAKGVAAGQCCCWRRGLHLVWREVLRGCVVCVASHARQLQAQLTRPSAIGCVWLVVGRVCIVVGRGPP